jgi:hypothetical protein
MGFFSSIWCCHYCRSFDQETKRSQMASWLSPRHARRKLSSEPPSTKKRHQPCMWYLSWLTAHSLVQVGGHVVGMARRVARGSLGRFQYQSVQGAQGESLPIPKSWARCSWAKTLGQLSLHLHNLNWTGTTRQSTTNANACWNRKGRLDCILPAEMIQGQYQPYHLERGVTHPP